MPQPLCRTPPGLSRDHGLLGSNGTSAPLLRGLIGFGRPDSILTPMIFPAHIASTKAGSQRTSFPAHIASTQAGSQ